MKARLPVIAIGVGRTVRYPTLTQAAEALGVSRYAVVTAYFTNTALRDGVMIDLAMEVTREQEIQLFRSWINARLPSRNRRREDDGIVEEELQDTRVPQPAHKPRRILRRVHGPVRRDTPEGGIGEP